MAQAFINLPLPPFGDGAGAAVLLPACTIFKTFVVSGDDWRANAVTLQASVDGIKWDNAAFFALNQKEPIDLRFSSIYVRANVSGRQQGNPIATLAIDTVAGETTFTNVPITGVPVDVLCDEDFKTILAGTTPQNTTGQVIIHVSADGVNFEPLFKVEGHTRSEIQHFIGPLKAIKAVPQSGDTDGMRIDIVCAPGGGAPALTVTDITWNITQDIPGFPNASNWCNNSLPNPPVISVTFSSAVDPLTVTGATVFLTGPGGPIAIGSYTFSLGNTVVSFSPAAPLTDDPTAYTVNVTAGVLTPTATPCTPATYAVTVIDCASTCETLIGGGSYPDTWTFAGQLTDLSSVSAPRGLIVPGLTRYSPTMLQALFFGGRNNGMSGTEWSNLVNNFLWSGVYAGSTPTQVYPTNFARRFIDSSVSSAVTRPSDCNVYVQGNMGYDIVGESGTIATVGSKALEYALGVMTQPTSINSDPGLILSAVPQILDFPIVRNKTNTLFYTAAGMVFWLGRTGTLFYDPNLLVTTNGASYPTADFNWNQFAACQLPDGRILVGGGIEEPTNPITPQSPTAKTSLYDPVLDIWQDVGPLNTARRLATFITLDSGRVLCVGGTSGVNAVTDSPLEWGSPVGMCEIWDPGTGLWSNLASLITPRTRNATVKLPTGQVMVIGGVDSSDNALATCEIIGSLNTWVPGPTIELGDEPVGLADVAAIVIPHPVQYTVVIAGGYTGPAGTVIINVDYILYLGNPTGGSPPGGGPLV